MTVSGHTVTMDVQIKRVYDPAEQGDGYRVLIDRLWPRGISKEHAALDLWCKDAAPSPELRRDWHATPDKESAEHFAAFTREYREELTHPPANEALARLAELAHEHKTLTLLYGAKNETVNHAVVLRNVLLEQLS